MACTMLLIIGKRFQDAALRELCVESGELTEGSVRGVTEGCRYNRGVRLHKLVYEALMRLVLQGFRPWIEENHTESKTIVLVKLVSYMMISVKSSSMSSAYSVDFFFTST